MAEADPLGVPDIYQKKWTIQKDWNIATAGSCFAQHITRHLRSNGYHIIDAEPAPNGLPRPLHEAFGYSLYSGRYGNIYTTRQLRQLIEEAFSDEPQDLLIWEKNGRFYDALRPNIEPDGFSSRQEVADARAYHLERLRALFLNVDLIVFTLGLTEAWVHKDTARVVPLAPGVVAGADQVHTYDFVNFSYQDVVSDFQAIMAVLREQRGRDLHYLLTVSPVPLTATASGNHVLAATTYSKSVLRAAAGFLSDKYENVDYFPSFEIITNPAARGVFFAANLRSVLDHGVQVVMKTFFSAHPPGTEAMESVESHTGISSITDVQCDDEMLEAFSK
ncbi:GSCFA domain-containing protein [Coralliovum pocilloporae]|uniref:GSCFA domain-containing protein n=1 Tax=Coralliovum pocilloporae TaxID=3066369 RepID=UPI003307AD4D